MLFRLLNHTHNRCTHKKHLDGLAQRVLVKGYVLPGGGNNWGSAGPVLVSILFDISISDPEERTEDTKFADDSKGDQMAAVPFRRSWTGDRHRLRVIP